MAVDARPFRIAHLSDLHCGGPYFEANLLERAISEVNEFQPDIVVCSGDLTTFGFKHEYQLAREYLDRIDCDAFVVVPGNHDARNVGYVHFEELFGDRSSVLRKGRRHDRRRRLDGARPRPRPDRPRPLRLDRGGVRRASRPTCRIFVLHHHLLAGSWNRAGAERRLRRGRRDRVPAARGRAPRALRAQARAVRVAAREPVRRQHRHGFVAPAPGKHETLLQRVEVNGHHVSISRRHPFHGEERIIQFSTETFEYEKYTGRIEREVTTRG